MDQNAPAPAMPMPEAVVPAMETAAPAEAMPAAPEAAMPEAPAAPVA